ncbi:acetate--CoA ligase family protein [Microbacterium sp. USTB-Y]|uniref:acetate--CoA ligase family protein n=1 Tax=Microbacterium sp. USTB-Y TaxID=2823692 RepID=UPI00203EEEB2|nr:acetate--CoA ligase family protein [Microbacterium sp. USTB-Y]
MISSECWTKLTRPRAIAIVGASERNGPASFAARFVASNEQVGFEGEIYFVNPRHDSVFGRPCYPDVASVPASIDVCVVNVAAPLVADAVKQGIRQGIRVFVVQAADFAEAGVEGARRQAELRDACDQAGAVLIGPNCLGYVHFEGHAAAYGAVLPTGIRSGEVAAVCGSGSVSVNLMRLGTEIGLHSVFSTGNEAVTTAEDIMEHLVEDPTVRVIAMFVETLRQPRRFRELAARAHDLDKPIIVLKSGVTETGAAAAQSHTGALVGSGRAYGAFFEQLGVVQVNDFDELRETVRLFSALGPRLIKANGVGLMSVSGGKATITADIAESEGVHLPAFEDSTLAKLSSALSLPAGIRCNNPVDLGIGFRGSKSLSDTIGEAMRAVADDSHIGAILIAQNLGDELAKPNPLEQLIIRAVTGAGEHLGVPVVVASDEGGRTSFAGVESMTSGDVVALRGLRPAAVAVAGLMRWYAPSRSHSEGVRSARREDGQTDILPTEIRELLDPAHTASLLGQYSIPVVQPIVITSREDVERADLTYPVVAKIVSPDVFHKSDVGGVVLGIRSPAELVSAWDRIRDAVASAQPSARFEGIVVSSMVAGAELFLGGHVDPELGPIVAIGMGGTNVELFAPPKLIVHPFSESDAREALDSMPGAELLRGFRGAPLSDVSAIAKVLCALGELTSDLADREASIDLNPFIVGEAFAGGIAVDARITVKALSGGIEDSGTSTDEAAQETRTER